MAEAVSLALGAVIVSVTRGRPRVLVVRQDGDETGAPDALPSGPFESIEDRTLEQSLRRLVENVTGLNLRYVEQLYTFGDRWRDPREHWGGARMVTVAYLALTHEAAVGGSQGAHWRDLYDYFPWEDWREKRPDLLENLILPALRTWADNATDEAERDERVFRIESAFVSGPAENWDIVSVLERYELLYAAGLVAEALRDTALIEAAEPAEAFYLDPRAEAFAGAIGRPMARDDRRILAVALARLRGKLRYRPLVFDLLPDEFTFRELQAVVEALSGVELHTQNFRRTVNASQLIETAGKIDAGGRGRPAELFRFRRDVLTEAPQAGVGLPLSRR